MSVLHRCDNPGCVNPAHLFLGTASDNVTDKVMKDRQAKGSGHGMAILSEMEVEIIRREVASGVRQTEMARRFGVGRTVIWSIVHNKTWKHLKEA